MQKLIKLITEDFLTQTLLIALLFLLLGNALASICIAMGGLIVVVSAQRREIGRLTSHAEDLTDVISWQKEKIYENKNN